MILRYVGQTGSQFKARFKEHIHAIKGNKDTSLFGQHILNIGHTHGGIEQWYSTFFVRVPPDIISLQLCTPKVVGT
jgi:hypothetical protein